MLVVLGGIEGVASMKVPSMAKKGGLMTGLPSLRTCALEGIARVIVLGSTS